MLQGAHHFESHPQATAAALTVMEAAFEGKAFFLPELIPALLHLLEETPEISHAASWALWWLRRGPVEKKDRQPYWQPTRDEIGTLLNVLERTTEAEKYTRCYLCYILGRSGDARAVLPLLAMVNESDPMVRRGVVEALGWLQDPLAIDSLATLLDDDDAVVCRLALIALGRFSHPQARAALHAQLSNAKPDTRQWAIDELAQHCEETDRRLLSLRFDGAGPWWDPQVPITATRVAQAAKTLSLPEAEIRRRYEALAPDFALKPEWL